jgi:hypothetical protein
LIAALIVLFRIFGVVSLTVYLRARLAIRSQPTVASLAKQLILQLLATFCTLFRALLGHCAIFQPNCLAVRRR